MSGIQWSGNRLIHHVRRHEEELGYVSLEPDSNSYVLWAPLRIGELPEDIV